MRPSVVHVLVGLAAVVLVAGRSRTPTGRCSPGGTSPAFQPDTSQRLGQVPGSFAAAIADFPPPVVISLPGRVGSWIAPTLVVMGVVGFFGLFFDLPFSLAAMAVGVFGTLAYGLWRGQSEQLCLRRALARVASWSVSVPSAGCLVLTRPSDVIALSLGLGAVLLLSSCTVDQGRQHPENAVVVAPGEIVTLSAASGRFGRFTLARVAQPAGTELWSKTRWARDFSEGQVYYFDGILVVTGVLGREGRVMAFNPDDGAALWERDLGRTPDLVVVDLPGDTLGVPSGHNLTVLAARSGDILWETDARSLRSVLVWGDALLFSTESGGVVRDPTTGQLLAELPGSAFCAAGEVLFSIVERDGRRVLEWRNDANGAGGSIPDTSYSDEIACGTYEGIPVVVGAQCRVAAVAPDHLELLWTIDLHGPLPWLENSITAERAHLEAVRAKTRRARRPVGTALASEAGEEIDALIAEFEERAHRQRADWDSKCYLQAGESRGSWPRFLPVNARGRWADRGDQEHRTFIVDLQERSIARSGEAHMEHLALYHWRLLGGHWFIRGAPTEGAAYYDGPILMLDGASGALSGFEPSGLGWRLTPRLLDGDTLWNRDGEPRVGVDLRDPAATWPTAPQVLGWWGFGAEGGPAAP